MELSEYQSQSEYLQVDDEVVAIVQNEKWRPRSIAQVQSALLRAIKNHKAHMAAHGNNEADIEYWA